MTGKERVTKTILLKEVDRIPWVPFVGCHGGLLIGKNAEKYLKSVDHIVNGVSEAIKKYDPDGIPVVFDLQIEAEALGCELQWGEENPPAVISHPLQEGIKLEDLKLSDIRKGRTELVMEATKKLRGLFPDIALYGLITGPYTLALHLLGTDIFMKMFEDPQAVHDIMAFTTQVNILMADLYIQNGCDIIALVDPMTSQIDPNSFETFVLPYAKEIFTEIRQKKVLSSFFVCGHAQQNIEMMCKCQPDNISIDENIPLDFVKEKALEHKISFGGNMKLTVVLLMGTTEDVQHHALECMDTGGNKGFVLAPGCDLPYATPPENIAAVTQLVQDTYHQDVVRTLERKTEELELLNLKDYGLADKVIVDVITLDSESCAPCQYMVEAVKRITPFFEDIVIWREHAIKKMESVTFMSSLMVKNIPTICIDGKITFVSQIPSQKELIDAIQKRINEKFRLRIKEKKAVFNVLCPENEDCSEILDRIKLAIKETGKEIEIKVINDKEIIKSFGVHVTPAVVVTQNKLKSQGETPTVEVIKEWLKQIG